MTVVLEDRPIEKVREEVIDQLIMNYGHGELSYEAFERRLDEAMETSNPQKLVSLVEDLSLEVDKAYVESKINQTTSNYSPDAHTENETRVSIFGGSDRTGRWLVPQQIKSVTVCGGGTLDFTDAIFTHPKTTLRYFSLFGGDDIYVPENVNVISKTFCIFGGIDNSSSSLCNPNAPTIVLEGFVIFSGVNIKIRRSIKERFVSFADEVKKMFQG